MVATIRTAFRRLLTGLTAAISPAPSRTDSAQSRDPMEPELPQKPPETGPPSERAELPPPAEQLEPAEPASTSEQAESSPPSEQLEPAEPAPSSEQLEPAEPAPSSEQLESAEPPPASEQVAATAEARTAPKELGSSDQSELVATARNLVFGSVARSLTLATLIGIALGACLQFNVWEWPAGFPTENAATPSQRDGLLMAMLFGALAAAVGASGTLFWVHRRSIA